MDMMAMRLYNPNDMRFERVAVPELDKGDVRVKVAYCGICETDEKIYSGTSSFWADGLIRTPMILGHECSGIVDGIGDDVAGIKVGDRVVLDPVVGCGACTACLHGRKLDCEKAKCLGTINSIDGGYAEYVVTPERGVHLLPDSISLADGALVEPLSIALHSVERANIQSGDVVVIAGTGMIGLGAIPFIRAKCAKTIIVIGRKTYKLETAKKFGADMAINMESEPVADIVKDITAGKGANCIIETTGSGEVLAGLFELAAYSAHFSIPAFYNDPMKEFPIGDVVLKNLSMEFVFSNADTCPRVIRMMESEKIDVSMLISRYFALNDAVQALHDLKYGSVDRIKYMLKMEGS